MNQANNADTPGIVTNGQLGGTAPTSNTVDAEINGSNLDSQDGDVSETSSFERSFEILSDNSLVKQAQSMDSSAKLNDTHEDTTSESKDVESKRKTSSEHIQSSRRKSGSFLSKLTSSTSRHDNTRPDPADTSAGQHSYTNLPSSFANLISSVSFTSGFRSSAGDASSSNGFASGSTSKDGLEQNVSKLTIETASTSTSVSTETREQILSKKACAERRNLISLTKLIVKDLISSSLTVGRTIDDNHQCAIHLDNYFTLLDRVLKHGLKQNILSNKSASLWNALDNLPRYLTDKRLTSETVRSLAHTKTPDGRIRAWLRIAMMQKKLPEYFNELLANRNVLLKDIYHDFAFMINDEAHVFAGLIIGVNVIDCNFFVKDDNFDTMDEVIELGPYLRAANSFDEDDQQQEKRNLIAEGADPSNLENLTAVLDQKNYLEERSLHLETTVESLRDKIKQLEELNGRLEMDARLNEARIQKLQAASRQGGPTKSDSPTNEKLLLSGFPIPDALKSLMNPSMDSKSGIKQPEQPKQQATADPAAESLAPTDHQDAIKSQSLESPQASVSPASRNDNDELQQESQVAAELEKARKLAADREKELANLRERVAILETSYRGALEKIRTLERELEVQTSMNGHKEATIKKHERDLRDSQMQRDSLRISLAEAKKLNAELSERLNDTGAKLKDRLNTVTSLQASLDKWKLENKTLATRYQDKLTALKSITTQLDQSLKTIEDLKKYNEKINDDLRKERECGQNSSITVEEQTGKISELTGRLNKLEAEITELRPYRQRLVDQEKRCQEYEQSLEEVGYQLRASREEVESLKENSSVFLDSQWMDSRQVKACALCQQAFSVTRRKHHCRLCGNVFCQTCSDNKMELASSAKPARVCDTCHAFLLAKFVKSSSSSAPWFL